MLDEVVALGAADRVGLESLTGGEDRGAVLGSLDGLLSITELVRRGGSQSDLVRAVAEVIAEKLGYQIVVVNLLRPEPRDLIVAECVGSAEAKHRLLGQTSPWSSWETVFDRAAVVVGEAHFLPQGTNDWGADGPPSWIPPEQGRDDPAGWRAEDALIVRMRDEAGRILGVISVDEPRSGVRPSRTDLAMLSAFCGHLASALEMASLNAVNRRQGRALARLAELSAAARHVTDPVPVLQEVVAAAAQTLELLGVEIAVLREGDLHRTASWGTVARTLAGWVESTLTATIASAPIRDGVFVLGAAEGRAEIICELRDLEDKLVGVLHAEAVELPGGEEAARRQLLRTFADTAQAAVGSAVHGAVVLSEARKDAMLATSLDAIVTTDQAGMIIDFNPAAEQTFRYSARDVIGQPLAELLVPERQRSFQRERFATLQGGERFEVMAMRADQSEFPAEISIGRVEWEATAMVISYVRDITAQREAQAELDRRRESAEHAANHDAVTGLLNVRGLHDVASVRCGTCDGALNLSLEGAASIYEGFGQTVGDTMMRTFAQRISAVASAEDAVAARAGDWEFFVLCQDEVIDDLADACREAVQKPLDIRGIAIALRCNLGATAEPASHLSELLRRATVARRQSAGQPRSCVLTRYREQDDTAAAQLRTASDLRTAISEGSLQLHYQPLLTVADGRLCSMEALVRWSRDGGRLIPPLDFIPLAEATGLIAPLAEWVLDEACRQITAWRDAGLEVPPIAINLSPYQLPHHDFPAVMRNTIKRHGLKPDQLSVEVTETALQVGAEKMEYALQELKTLGVRCALDDFGADYSSLTRLATLPFSTVKIDRSFLTHVPADGRATALIGAIAGVARSLGLQTTAEGIETREQWDVLSSAGIETAQGYLLGKPLPAKQTSSLLRPAASKASVAALTR